LAADCALVLADATVEQAEEEDLDNQVWTAYYAVITDADAVVVDDTVSTSPDPTVPEDLEPSESAFPVDWRENRKWNDGEFCNVNDPLTDYLIKVDSETSDVDDRKKCFDYCAENRIE
jgi:hypothetical protein